MAELRDSSFNFNTGTATTVVMPAINVVSGDLLICLLTIDTGTSDVTATGWTQLYKSTNTCQQVLMYKISDGSETDVTFTYALETCVACMMSIKDVDTTNPFGAPTYNNASGGTTAKVTFQTISTTVNNSMLLFVHSRATVGIPSILEGPATSIFAGDGGAESMAIAWGFQAASGTTPSDVVSSGISVGAGTKSVIQISPPSGGATVIPTYCAADASLYVDPISGTSAYNGNTAMAITADTGFSTSLGGFTAADAAVAAVADVGINSFHSVARLTSISASKNLAGLELVILDANRPNVAGKNVLVHLGPSTEGQLQRFSSVASGRGIWFGMRSGAASNWKIWQVYGVEHGSTRHVPVIINDTSTTTKSTNGTLDTSLVKAFGFWASGSGVTTTIWDFASLWVLDTCTLSGGIAAYPIGIPGIVRAAATGKERKSVVLQGAKQALILSHIQIGNGGTNPVYLDLDGTAIEFPKQYSQSTSEASYNSANNVCGLTYYAGASDTIKHRNSVISSASRYKWGLHTSFSTSCTPDFSGLSVIGAGTISLARAITITSLTINNYSTLDVTALTLVSSNISNPPATSASITTGTTAVLNLCTINVSTVTAGNHWWTGADPTSIFTNCAFTGGGGHALQISAAGGSSITLTGNTWTGFGADGSTGAALNFTASSGIINVTITGGTTPTYKTAGATINLIVGLRTIKVAVTKVGGVVTDANVFLAAAAGGPFPSNAAITSITRSGITATVTHTAVHGMATNDQVNITGITDKIEDNIVHIITYINTTQYSYTTTDSGSVSYTGTKKGTFVFLKGLASAGTGSNEISMSRTIPSTQPITGWARKTSTPPDYTPPNYKEGVIGGDVSSTGDTTFNPVLISDD